MATRLVKVGCKFANGYVRLFIIPYSGKAGSGLDHCVDFVYRCAHYAASIVGDGRPDAVWFNVFDWF